MPYAPHEGTSLGKHVLVRRLGEGSLGTVWEARKLDTDEHVALKVIEPDPSALRNECAATEARLELEPLHVETISAVPASAVWSLHGHCTLPYWSILA